MSTFSLEVAVLGEMRNLDIRSHFRLELSIGESGVLGGRAAPWPSWRTGCLFSIIGVCSSQRSAPRLPLLVGTSLAREWPGKPLARLKYTRGSLIALPSRLCRYFKSAWSSLAEGEGKQTWTKMPGDGEMFVSSADLHCFFPPFAVS